MALSPYTVILTGAYGKSKSYFRKFRKKRGGLWVFITKKPQGHN